MPRPSPHPGAEVALVALGGALGSLARWGLAEALPGPAGTLAANVSGCFAIGVLAAAAALAIVARLATKGSR